MRRSSAVVNVAQMIPQIRQTAVALVAHVTLEAHRILGRMLESLVVAQLGRLLKAAIALIARMTERQLTARMMVANVSPQTFDASEISTALFTTAMERNKQKHSMMALR